MARAMKHQAALLFSSLGRHKPHIGTDRRRGSRKGRVYGWGAGLGARDVGGVPGAREDGDTGMGLRAGAADGCAEGSGIFAISSATAASKRAISRAI